MDFLQSLQKQVNSRVTRVLLKRPQNGIKPSDLRSELKLKPSCSNKTRRDGLCIAFLNSNFEANLAEFKALNDATLKKHNIEVVQLTQRSYNIVLTYLDVIDNDQMAMLKTMIKCDKLSRHTVRGIETADMVASYSSFERIPPSFIQYLTSEARMSSSTLYAQNFCVKCREFLSDRQCPACQSPKLNDKAPMTNIHAPEAPSSVDAAPKDTATITPTQKSTDDQTSESSTPSSPQLSPLLIRTPTPSPLKDNTQTPPPNQSPTPTATVPASYCEDNAAPNDFDVSDTEPKDAAAENNSSSDSEESADEAIPTPTYGKAHKTKGSPPNTTGNKNNSLLKRQRKPDEVYTPPSKNGSCLPSNDRPTTRSSTKDKQLNHVELANTSRSSLDTLVPALK